MTDTSRAPAPGARRPRRRAWLIVGIAMAAACAVIIAALVFGARGGESPTTPGAAPQTTPDIAALAGDLADQQIEWEECVFQEEIPGAAPPAGTDVSNLECATITVPKDWLEPVPGETWDVRISHAKNIDSDDPGYHTTVLAHPGGPVTPGLSYSALVQSLLPTLRETTNFVSFDQRGLGQSSHAQCDYEYVSDPADENAAVRAIAEACARNADVATMTTEQAVYDMDFIRHLLGLETVSYFGASYGTWIGAWFGTLFGENIERMLLDSAVDFTQPSIQSLYESAYAGRDRQFRLHLMNYIARHDETLGLGDDPGAIWERYFAATTAEHTSLAAALAWTASGLTIAFSTSLGYPPAGELVASIIAVGDSAGSDVGAVDLAEQMIAGIPSLPEDRRAAAIAAVESTLALYAPPPAPPGEVVRGTFDSLIEFTKCADGEWTQGEEYWDAFTERTAREAPFSNQLLLVETPICAFWPTGATVPTPNERFPQTVVLQSELDSQTPYEQGQNLGVALENTSLIVIDNESAHGVFPYGTETVDQPVIDFLAGGERPAPITVADAKPIGSETTAYESWTPIDDDATHDSDEPRFTDPMREADTAVPTADSETP